MKGPGLLRRLVGRGSHEALVNGDDSAAAQESASISGIFRDWFSGLPNADGTAFPVDGRSAGTSAQATRTARERRRIRRSTDHHCRGLARGLRAGTGRRSHGRPASPRRTTASTSVSPGPDSSGVRSTPANALLQVVWCVHRRSCATSGDGRRCWSKFASELDYWFWSGDDHVLVTLHAISPEAMEGYSERLCTWFAREMPFERSGDRTGWR